MFFIGLGEPYELVIDFGSAILGIVLMLLIWGGVSAMRRKDGPTSVTMALLVAVGGVYFLYLTHPAPSASWPIMYAALYETHGAEQKKRRLELTALWRSSAPRTIDWYRLARMWGICHGMWKQENCRLPTGPFLPEGSVRDHMLSLSSTGASVARDAPKPPPRSVTPY